MGMLQLDRSLHGSRTQKSSQKTANPLLMGSSNWVSRLMPQSPVGEQVGVKSAAAAAPGIEIDSKGTASFTIGTTVDLKHRPHSCLHTVAIQLLFVRCLRTCQIIFVQLRWLNCWAGSQRMLSWRKLWAMGTMGTRENREKGHETRLETHN